MYFKCLEAAKKSWDRAAEADLGQAEGRCRACSALALALDLLGQPDKALAELTLVHTISEQAGDTYLQAQACRSLGTLYSKMGRLDAASDLPALLDWKLNRSELPKYVERNELA
eukprot:gene25369-31820_t